MNTEYFHIVNDIARERDTVIDIQIPQGLQYFLYELYDYHNHLITHTIEEFEQKFAELKEYIVLFVW